MSSIAVKHVPYSEIRVMFDAAKKLEADGHDVVHLEIGRPDFDTPAHIVEACVRAMREGKLHYPPNAGIMELREAIAEKYKREHQLDYNPANNILVTNGVAEGMYLAISANVNPGEEVLIPNPAFPSYEVIPTMSFIHPVSYSLKVENNFIPDIKELEEKVTNRTKMIVLVSPSNPIGSVIPKESLLEIAAFAKKHDLIVLTDEIYEHILYDGKKHETIAAMEDMRDRTIVLSGFSKYYSMTGWRVGYALAHEKFIRPMLLMHSYALGSTTTFAQWGALEALTGDQTPSQQMMEEFERRRNYIVEGINSIPGFDCPTPEGAFYTFPLIKETGKTSRELAHYLLQEAHVVTVAGNGFGSLGEGHLRFSFAASMEDLKKAVDRIDKAMKKII